MGRERINPFALGGAFVNYCVEKGYIELLMDDHEVQYYLTAGGEQFLQEQFGMTLGACVTFKG